MTGTPMLDVRALRVEFPGRHGTVTALADVSLTISPGEILGVVGESGAGKSMTGLAVQGLLEPPGHVAGGEVWLNGRRIDTLSDREMQKVRGREIGAIFQDPLTSLNPLFSVGKQLIETIRLHLPLNRAEARQRAIDLLTEVGIPAPSERVDHFPHQFSGGMRQRVVIALALAARPKLIIADEPTTALDVTIQAQILELVKELRQKLGMAIIWITHDLGVIAGIADRVMVMYGGQVVEQAPVKELFSNPQHPYTRALLKSIPKLGGVREARLQAIDGQPPILSAAPVACAFRSRCPLAFARCEAENPARRPVDGLPLGEGHDAACHLVGQPAEAAHV